MQRLTKSSTTTLLPQLSLSLRHHCRRLATSSGNKDDEWNDAWETAWLPDDLAGKNTRAPWESDVNFGLTPDVADPETKAFVEDMNENWEQRRMNREKAKKEEEMKRKKEEGGENGGLYSLENVQKDYRLKKQRVHAGLWMKEIELLEEAKLGGGSGDDIDKLLDSCSEIFDSASNNLNDPKVPSTSEFKNKPDGWESTSKSEDGNVWEMSQREEDILLQEFERRMAFCKFQIASFIKTHIFSRRRPIDGWRYMIEVIGPNARKGKGSVSRLPGLADPATQPFTEDRPPRSGGRLSVNPDSDPSCFHEVGDCLDHYSSDVQILKDQVDHLIQLLLLLIRSCLIAMKAHHLRHCLLLLWKRALSFSQMRRSCNLSPPAMKVHAVLLA